MKLGNDIRKIIYDSYPIRTFVFKPKEDRYITISSSEFVLKNSLGEILFDASFENYPDMGSLAKAFLEVQPSVVFGITPLFSHEYPTKNTLKLEAALTEEISWYRHNFFSDEQIYFVVNRYMDIHFPEYIGESTENKILMALIPNSRQYRHCILWCGFNLLYERRVSEFMSARLSTSFSDGSAILSAENYKGSINVSIGSVFSISDELSPSVLEDKFNRVGSESQLGDTDSVWFRLQMYIRSLMENEFADFSLRPNEVMQSTIILERPLDFFSYFGSYPFVTSPDPREVM